MNFYINFSSQVTAGGSALLTRGQPHTLQQIVISGSEKIHFGNLFHIQPKAIIVPGDGGRAPSNTGTVAARIRKVTPEMKGTFIQRTQNQLICCVPTVKVFFIHKFIKTLRASLIIFLIVSALSKSPEPLDLAAMDIIAAHMDGTWKDLARRLRFSDGQIHQFHEDHHIRGIKEVIYQFLLEWKQNADPTLGTTVKALWANKNDEVIQKLVEEYWIPKQNESSATPAPDKTYI